MNKYSDMIDQMGFPRNVTIDLKNDTKQLYSKLKKHLYKNIKKLKSCTNTKNIN